MDIINLFNKTINDIIENIHAFIKSDKDFTRHRLMDAESVIKTIFRMQGQSLDTELLNLFPNTEKRITASGFIQQKSKLTSRCFEEIFHTFNKKLEKNSKLKLLNNKYRVYAVDGSDFNPMWNPKSENIIKTTNKSGEMNSYYQIHANLLSDIINKTFINCSLQPKAKMNERSAAVDFLKGIDDDNFIFIADRGYMSFNLIEHCNRHKGCKYVIRSKVHHGAIREVDTLPDQEYDNEIQFRVTTSNHYFTKNHKMEPDLHLVTHIRKHYKEKLSKNTKDTSWDFDETENKNM
ncbi:transposase [Ligilactobacillus salivarius]|uniref:transposase n=1 Tax=Ligilactobacillus salivarius TaxID=1624 RepID=UPI001CDA9A99|nr:transposase [Ligilactobacillus salivarius]